MGTGDKKRQGVKLTDNTPAFSARLRMSAAVPLLLHRHSGVHRDIYLRIKFQVRLQHAQCDSDLIPLFLNR